MNQLIFVQDIQQAKRLSKAVSKGQLKRVRQGIYTDAAWEAIPQLLHSKWYQVVEYLYPTAIISHSTAVSLLPNNNMIYITAAVKIRKKIRISDKLIIEVLPGDITSLSEPFQLRSRKSAPERYLLENLQISHKDVSARKTLGKQWVEQELCRLLKEHGEQELSRIREQAQQNCEVLNMEKEFKILNHLIGTILSSQTNGVPTSPTATTNNRSAAFDSNRIDCFEQMAAYLQSCKFIVRPYQYSASSWRNLAFFESYFSNHITKPDFKIDEAEQIIFQNSEIENRRQDSHDVMAVYNIVQDDTVMSTVPNSPDELLDFLVQRHALIMNGRPDKRPGLLKNEANRAGDSVFVSPDQVEGTLSRAFPIYQELQPGLARAIFMQFLVSECHPFDDGNGRLARIMMNAELVCTKQTKVIVPTAHRDRYLNGLRQATRSYKYRTISKVFCDLHAYTHSIPWSDYARARKTLESQYANILPEQGVGVFNRQLSKYKIALPPG